MVRTALESTRIIAIIRNVEGDALNHMIAALYDGGIRLAEITMNTSGAAKAIAGLREKYDGVMCIGAGTVTDVHRARHALDAGAQFVVTPNVDKAVIGMCVKKNVLIAPGALTPTEIVTAMSLGCEYVKLFPARSMGSAYLKDILAPLDNAKLIVVGGIGENNAREYIQNGAVGIGVGGSLCKVPSNGDYDAISTIAARLIVICKDAE